MSFEGSEKRLEIGFTIPSTCSAGLRRISRSEIDQLMELAHCSIISQCSTQHVDAYVLSESSCFVSRETFILKTCGRTRILNAVGQIRSITTQLGFTVRYVKYSRASFLFPDEQAYPHQRFETEVSELSKSFEDLNGAAYVLGDQCHGLQWHLFYASVSNRLRRVDGDSIEICLKGLNPRLAQRFIRNATFVDARTTTLTVGIADLLPDAVLDDYVFAPCGYSMNGLSDAGILTVHVTPEDCCSYASIEFSCLKPNAVDLHSTLLQIVKMFDPREMHIAIHALSADDLSLLKQLQAPLAGYSSDGLSVQYLSDGGYVLFKANLFGAAAAKNESPLSASFSFSSRSDDNSVSDCYQIDDTPSVLSTEDKASNPLTPAIERKYNVQSIDQCSLEIFMKSLIREKDLRQTFYVMNLTTAQKLYMDWRRIFPRIEPFYAVKCNPDPVLMRLLGSLGAGFDCASKEEIQLVLDLGVPAAKIIFANACKHPDDIRAATESGVGLTTFDTPLELEKIKEGATNSTVLLRIRADDPEARCLLGNKYGAQMETLSMLYQKAKELGVKIVGVSFHVGSGATNPDAFSSAICIARQAFDLGLEYGFHMSILDIGGGFCAGKTIADMNQVQIAVNAALDRCFPIGSGVKIIAEPGRYFAERCATLACYIQGMRERRSPSGALLKDYWITDGLYGSFNCILYDHATPKAIPLKCCSEKTPIKGYFPSTVFGPTCDGLDTVMIDVMLPELSVGDWLLFPDMGAYTLAGASNFNGINATDVQMFYVWADFEEPV